MVGTDADFADFVDAQMASLLGLAYALTANQHDAWDLVQEALVRVGLRWQRLRSEQPAAYARTVLVRLNIDRLRRLRREHLVTQVRDEVTCPVIEIGSVEPWLIAGLQRLSARQRTAIALRYVEDLDVSQVALRMGCSSGTAKSHLSRGLKRLREEAAVHHVPAATRGE